VIEQRNPNGTIKGLEPNIDGKRWCSRCMDYLPETDFYKDSRGINGLARRCKRCHSQKSYESRKKTLNTLSKRRAYHRKRTLAKYNINETKFDELLSAQEYRCAICKNVSTQWWNNESNKGLVVDHNHKCGHVRGLLCDKCNSALGYFEDNIEYLDSAKKYLLNHSCEGSLGSI